MNTIKTSGVSLVINLFVLLPIVTFVTFSVSSCGRNKNWEASLAKIAPPPVPPPLPKPPTMEGSDTIWKVVDESPLFPGGEELLVKHISNNIRYPESAKKNGIQGQVVIKFCISKKGKLSDYEVYKSASPDLDAEALRVVKTITRFEPGRKDGEPVSTWHYIPINFKLK